MQVTYTYTQVATLRALASTFLVLQQFGAAISHSTEALALEPNSAAVLMLRARAHVLRRDYTVSTFHAPTDLRRYLP